MIMADSNLYGRNGFYSFRPNDSMFFQCPLVDFFTYLPSLFFYL